MVKKKKKQQKQRQRHLQKIYISRLLMIDLVLIAIRLTSTSTLNVVIEQWEIFLSYNNWLIFSCLTTSGKYVMLMHIQGKNKFNNILKLYRNQKDTRPPHHALENHCELGKDEQFSLLHSRYKTLILFRKLTNRVFYVLVAWYFDSTLPTMVLHQGFLYFNLTTLITPSLVLDNTLIISLGIICEIASVSSETITGL